MHRNYLHAKRLYISDSNTRTYVKALRISTRLRMRTAASYFAAVAAPKPVQIFDARRRPLVRRKAVEGRYGISSRCLDNWMKQRKIPFYKIGGALFFSIEKVDAALEKFEIKAVAK